MDLAPADGAPVSGPRAELVAHPKAPSSKFSKRGTRAAAVLHAFGVSPVELREFGIDLEVAERADVPCIRQLQLDAPWLTLLEALPRELQGISSPELNEPKALQRLLRAVLVEALVVWRLDEPGLQLGVRLRLAPRELEVQVPGGSLDLQNPLLASLLRAQGHWTDGLEATARMAEDQGFALSTRVEGNTLLLRLERRRTLVRAATLARRARTPAAARRELILDSLRAAPGRTATNSTLRAITGIARQTLSRDLSVLEEEGLVCPTEEHRTSRNQAWQLTSGGGRG